MTAVEWLYEQMNNIKGSSISMNGRVQFIEKELNKLLEKAKIMEKEQIKEAQQVQKGDYCAVCGCREFWNDEEE